MGAHGSGRAVEGGPDLSSAVSALEGAEAPELPRGVPARPRRVHGRRKGRKLTARQQVLIDTLLPELRLDLDALPSDAGKLGSLFPMPVSEVWLEIGFGGGEHLIWQARTAPHAGLLGAEPFVNGVVSALAAMEEHGLQGRVRLHDDDVSPLLDRLPEGSLARVFMLFPDPWPKLRHRRRRLLSGETLGRIASLLRPGGEFRFASDIKDYADAARDLCHAEARLRLTADFTSASRDTLPGWPATRYEAKAAREGRTSTFLSFTRS